MTKRATASVVIPAHNESQVVEDTLRTLLDGVPPETFDVVVVCNGCTDDTADRARSVPGVRVLEIAEPSKARAVEVGNRATTAYPRVHLDADVAIAGADVLRLVEPIRSGEALATAPRRVVPMTGCSWTVRAYYRVWQSLPEVRAGLFGRGVVAVSAAGQARVDLRAGAMNDDLAMSEAFLPTERRVVSGASVVVHPPRTTADLLNRRTRIATGNSQAVELGVRRTTSTSVATLAQMAVRDPRIGLRVPVFVAVGLLARRRSRRAVRSGDYTTWLRDESSRLRVDHAPTSR
jgi:glycosyl transferase family 2